MTTLSAEFLKFANYPEISKHCRIEDDEEFYRFCALVLVAKTCKQCIVDFAHEDRPFDSMEDCGYFKGGIDYLTAEVENLNDCNGSHHIKLARI